MCLLRPVRGRRSGLTFRTSIWRVRRKRRLRWIRGSGTGPRSAYWGNSTSICPSHGRLLVRAASLNKTAASSRANLQDVRLVVMRLERSHVEITKQRHYPDDGDNDADDLLCPPSRRSWCYQPNSIQVMPYCRHDATKRSLVPLGSGSHALVAVAHSRLRISPFHARNMNRGTIARRAGRPS